MRNVRLLLMWLILSAMALQALADERLHAPVDGDVGTVIGQASSAERGLMESPTHWGRRYLNGQGTAEDYRVAARWLRRAAEQGSAQAQTALGTLYLRGLGVKQDPYAAMDWFFEAAEQGDIEAQYHLGVMYAYGIGVLRQDGKARDWLQRAAALGHQQAQRELKELRRRIGAFRRRYPLPDMRRIRRNLYG